MAGWVSWVGELGGWALNELPFLGGKGFNPPFAPVLTGMTEQKLYERGGGGGGSPPPGGGGARPRPLDMVCAPRPPPLGFCFLFFVPRPPPAHAIT
eukprot:COSAG01_NODE_7791_length_3055_cov_4.866373_1_plen_95_part_10